MGKNNSKANAVQGDIQRIDTVLASNDIDAIKSLHIELDGTYQNLIQNWGLSLYGYAKEFGFNYEWLGEDSLRHNLLSMKSKLRGYLLELDSNTESATVIGNTETTIKGHRMTKKQRMLLADYDEIKRATVGNYAIAIPDQDYPKYKDTLDYLVGYEYIRPAKIDGDIRLFIKTPAFDLFTEYLLSQEPEDTEMEKGYSNKKVFIVHGHDHQLLNDIELMLMRIGLEPVILKNEANSGRTIIEKIEALSDVGYGIVLYTGCDEGRKKGNGPLKERARQNVIFEHGYLYAKLGRERVAALNDDGIEIPSDLSGVLYISHSASDWKNQLMREMKSAGLEFDSTKA